MKSNKSKSLRALFNEKLIVRIVGAHDGLGAKLIERNKFDGIWASGLEISTAYGVPDANILTMSEYFHAASVMNEATLLPVICDCDTGYGNASNVIHMVKKYEAAGLAAVVIEDKIFPKVNSFVPGRQDLAPMTEFMGKIEAAKHAQINPDFMVFARVEALIAGWGMEEAVRRAYAYAESGADGIVIHSSATTPDEVYEFSKRWSLKLPLVVIPTTYYQVKAEEFARQGFKMVIYANQGLRASIRAVDETLKAIREADSTATVEDKIAPMREVFQIQGMPGMKENEKRFDKRETIQAIILAAGDHHAQIDLSETLKDKPLCMLPIGGKPLLERQADILRSCGVTDILVTGGYQSDKIKVDGATVLFNPDYKISSIASSLMMTRDHWDSKCVMAYSDIIFDRQIPERLLESPHPITLVIDRAFQTLPFREKEPDLVIVEDAAKQVSGRNLRLNTLKMITRIGKNLDKEKARHEFIGLALFNEEGLRILSKLWDEALVRFKGKAFYEAPGVEKADLMDLIQYAMDCGHPVHGLEIEHGWSELHSLEDFKRVSQHYSGAAKSVSERL